MPLTIDGSRREETPSTSAFLLYHARSHVTGRRLGDYLGIPHGRETNGRRNWLIRWGSRSGAGWRPSRGVVNSRSALNNNTDKLDAHRQLSEAGIPVPDWATSREEFREELDYPILGRQRSHSRGEDINLILQWRDDYFTENEWFVDYIPTDREYRMHVVNGEVVCTHEKRKQSDAPNHPFIRNSDTGYIFMEPRETPPTEQLAIDSVGALGLDMGAVDIVREEETGDFYVLEVNSAPSLDEANLQRYGDALAEIVGVDEVAGLDAVDFEEDEEEPEDSGGIGELLG